MLSVPIVAGERSITIGRVGDLSVITGIVDGFSVPVGLVDVFTVPICLIDDVSIITDLEGDKSIVIFSSMCFGDGNGCDDIISDIYWPDGLAPGAPTRDLRYCLLRELGERKVT